MYNAEQKERFIRDYSTKISVRKSVVSLFDKFAPYEEQWGADLCTQSVETIQPVFDRIAGVRESSRLAPRTILRKYSDWCIENHVEGATDAARMLASSGVENLRTQMLKNPRQLQAFLDLICEPESERTADNNIRAYYWLAYAGMDDKDILLTKADDVDLSLMVLHFGGRDYPIYREALPAISNCMKLTEYRIKHPNYGPDKIVMKDRIPGDELLRGIKAVTTIHAMRVELSRRNREANRDGKTDLKLSYYRIWLSGVFYRMWEDELAGFPVDFSSFVEDRLGDFQYKLPPNGNSQEYMHKKMALSYQEDYERWKMILM